MRAPSSPPARRPVVGAIAGALGDAVRRTGAFWVAPPAPPSDDDERADARERASTPSPRPRNVRAAYPSSDDDDDPARLHAGDAPTPSEYSPPAAIASPRAHPRTPKRLVFAPAEEEPSDADDAAAAAAAASFERDARRSLRAEESLLRAGVATATARAGESRADVVRRVGADLETRARKNENARPSRPRRGEEDASTERNRPRDDARESETPRDASEKIPPSASDGSAVDGLLRAELARARETATRSFAADRAAALRATLETAAAALEASAATRSELRPNFGRSADESSPLARMSASARANANALGTSSVEREGKENLSLSRSAGEKVASNPPLRAAVPPPAPASESASLREKLREATGEVEHLRVTLVAYEEATRKAEYQKGLLLDRVLALERELEAARREREEARSAVPSAPDASSARLLPEVVRLWRHLRVPLLHRARFFLAFRGREAFYFEAERRRLEWIASDMNLGADLHGERFFSSSEPARFAPRASGVISGRSANPAPAPPLAPSLRAAEAALRRERDDLRRLARLLTPPQLEAIFARWGVPTEARRRKARLADALFDPADVADDDELELSRHAELTLQLRGVDAAERAFELVHAESAAAPTSRLEALGEETRWLGGKAARAAKRAAERAVDFVASPMKK